MPAALRSAAFRFAVLLALVFAVGSALLLILVQHQIGSYAVEATNGTLSTEATILKGEYDELGQSGLIDAMIRHAKAGAEPQFRYVLIDGGGRSLHGDLPRAAARVGWSRFSVTEHEAGITQTETMTGLGTRLSDGLLLVVATDNFDVDRLRARLSRFALFGGIGITLFALIGGYLSGQIFLRRLTRVNDAVDRIVDGDKAERLPAIGFGPEFDDLTRNLNRMLDRNAAAMEALRQVSTDIAHDLRTPLSRLHQRLEAMRDATPIGARDIDDALDQTTNLLGIFQALLRIGTVEGGVGRQRFKPVNLSELLDRIHQAYQPVAEDADHILIADHAPDVVIDGDAELLAQLFTNLVENAIVHTPAGSTITSRLSVGDDFAVAEICDTGAGIPASERTKVFQRFYRLDRSRQSDGAGLGLSLVAAIATLHSADYTIPEAGEGLRVRVRFPAARLIAKSM